MPGPPRYLPERAFPPYAFLPGRAPHPRRHPDGHSYGRDEPPADYCSPSSWGACAAYLWGVDLYNHGYPWEAHEAWESLWIASRAQGDERQTAFLQGLILLAAAAVKVRIGEPASVERLCERARARLGEVAAHEPTYMGIELAPLLRAIEQLAAGAEPPPIELHPDRVA